MCIIVLGRLGKDAEVSQTSNGTKFVRFTLAENKYRNGEDKTIWYDVISYDPFVINTQIKVLKKGTFAVVVGGLDSKINIGKTGSVYLNHNITAWNINVPNISGGNRSETNVSESTIAENSPTISLEGLNKESKPSESKPEVKAEPTPVQKAIVQPTVEEDDDDELPF